MERYLSMVYETGMGYWSRNGVPNDSDPKEAYRLSGTQEFGFTATQNVGRQILARSEHAQVPAEYLVSGFRCDKEASSAPPGLPPDASVEHSRRSRFGGLCVFPHLSPNLHVVSRFPMFSAERFVVAAFFAAAPAMASVTVFDSQVEGAAAEW